MLGGATGRILPPATRTPSSPAAAGATRGATAGRACTTAGTARSLDAATARAEAVDLIAAI